MLVCEKSFLKAQNILRRGGCFKNAKRKNSFTNLHWKKSYYFQKYIFCQATLSSVKKLMASWLCLRLCNDLKKSAQTFALHLVPRRFSRVKKVTTYFMQLWWQGLMTTYIRLIHNSAKEDRLNRYILLSVLFLMIMLVLWSAFILLVLLFDLFFYQCIFYSLVLLSAKFYDPFTHLLDSVPQS